MILNHDFSSKFPFKTRLIDKIKWISFENEKFEFNHEIEINANNLLLLTLDHLVSSLTVCIGIDICLWFLRYKKISMEYTAT